MKDIDLGAFHSLKIDIDVLEKYKGREYLSPIGIPEHLPSNLKCIQQAIEDTGKATIDIIFSQLTKFKWMPKFVRQAIVFVKIFKSVADIVDNYKACKSAS
jgi:hypothetical protein